MSNYSSDTLNELDRARVVAVAFESEVARLEAEKAQLVDWLKAGPCGCVYEQETNSWEPCERCLWLDEHAAPVREPFTDLAARWTPTLDDELAKRAAT